MAEELAIRSSQEDEFINSNSNSNSNNSQEVEEGEIEDDNNNNQNQSEPSDQIQAHPLEHAWTFWFDNPSNKNNKNKQEAWGSSIHPVHTFSTVEDFWRLYNNIHHPSKLTVGADLYCFKDKIEPKWEDPVCANGGKWTIINSQRIKTDTLWLYTLLAMIGEQFDYGDEICGAVVNVRKNQERISIWTKNASNESAQMSIGKQWKEILDQYETIGFIVHDDAMKQERSAKPIYSA